MTTLLIANVNVKTQTTFLDFSLSQSQLNEELGNGQGQYLMPYVS
jgi:hypothetical protein